MQGSEYVIMFKYYLLIEYLLVRSDDVVRKFKNLNHHLWQNDAAQGPGQNKSKLLLGNVNRLAQAQGIYLKLL